MRIYFYDGDLGKASINMCMPHFEDAFYVDAKRGPTYCRKQLDMLDKANVKYVVTNSLIALSHYYGWDKVENHTDIYLYKEDLNTYVRIDELTNREIRYAHNIEKMYLSGVFN